jgi:hypothetical protein
MNGGGDVSLCDILCTVMYYALIRTRERHVMSERFDQINHK